MTNLYNRFDQSTFWLWWKQICCKRLPIRLFQIKLIFYWYDNSMKISVKQIYFVSPPMYIKILVLKKWFRLIVCEFFIVNFFERFLKENGKWFNCINGYSDNVKLLSRRIRKQNYKTSVMKCPMSLPFLVIIANFKPNSYF